MAVVEQVLVTTAVVGLLFVVTVGVTATVVVRRVRRRLRAWRGRLLGARTPPPDVWSVLPQAGSAAAASLGSPAWWSAQSRRHRLWKAVSSAEHAVGVARRAGVAVGDLPALAARLHTAADGVDALLRASGRHGTLREQDRRDCDRILAAAEDLREAALSSLRSDSHADTDTVVSAVQIEVAALASGLRAAHG